MTVFTFKINHIDSDRKIIDIDEKQERYVLAETEEEAEEKIEKYRKEMVSKGFADFIIQPNPIVEFENVIV